MRASQVAAHQAADMAGLLDILADLRSGWRKQGACRRPDADPGWFSPKVGNVPVLARQVCAVCPVVAECARFGADQADPAFNIGTVWAGEYPNQLRRWRDSNSPEWQALMAGRTRVTEGMRKKGTSRAA